MLPRFVHFYFIKIINLMIKISLPVSLSKSLIAGRPRFRAPHGQADGTNGIHGKTHQGTARQVLLDNGTRTGERQLLVHPHASTKAAPRATEGARTGKGRYITFVCLTTLSTWHFFFVQMCPILKARMMQTGTLMVGYQPDDRRPNFFRNIISSAAVTEEDVDFLLNEMDRLGHDL